MSGASLPIQQIRTMLAATPARIAELTEGLTTTQLHTAANAGEWSANVVLAHLRSCADVWGNCIVTILNQDKPTIRAVNPRTWIKSTNYPEQDFHSSLAAFTAQRTELLIILQPLKSKSWSRSARVIGAGKELERSVHTYAEWIAIHERPHLKQMERIASAANNT